MNEERFVEHYLRTQFTAPIADYMDCIERVREARQEFRRLSSAMAPIGYPIKR